MRRQRIMVVCLLVGTLRACLAGTDIHVAPSGSDSGDGSAQQPFATLERAREAARISAKPVTVWLAGGSYVFPKPFVLTAEDSGTEKEPVTWRAEEGQTPRLLGGRPLSATDFHPVTDPETLARMAPEARGKIVELDLKAAGVVHSRQFPDVFTDSGGIAWLYCDGRRMPLARFPKQGYMTIKQVLNNAGGPQGDWRNAGHPLVLPPGSPGGTFEYREEFYGKHAAWASQVERGVWLQGYWRVAWEDPAIRVQAIDPAAHTVTLAKPIPNGIGNKYTRPKGNGREAYWLLNLLEEITQPGEWALDFKDQKIYFYPPEDLAKANVMLLDKDEPVISIDGASHVILRGLTVEANLGDGIRVTGGEGNLVAGCTVRWVNKYAIVFDGGRDDMALSNDLYDLGAGGVWLGGGDEASIPRIPANHKVVNNHIHDFGQIERVYAPGVNCGFTGGGSGGHHAAVGMLVAHNLIHDTPHGGILFGSMDSVFEFNEIYRYCLVSNDLGAFYSYDYASRHFGNITFRYNFMHSSAIGDGIYFDHDHPDMKIHGNIACLKSISRRGTGFLYKIGDQAKIPQGIDCTNNIAIQDNTGFVFVSVLPNRGKIENNVSVMCKAPMVWREVKNGKEIPSGEYATGENKSYDSDPGFVDMANLNFRLKGNAQLLKDLPGFKPIPVEQIGLYLDEYRKSLPGADELDRQGVNHVQDAGLGYDILDRR